MIRRFCREFSICMKSFLVGDQIANFVVKDVKRVPEIDATVVRLIHATGMEHIHVARNDSNNAFAIGFKTPPYKNTGLTHILEHVALCGSEKYKVRDPFFKMLNRSLSNYMNALTGHDYTIYPFSTANKNDYMNLMSVYMDSTFRPLITYYDFLQEGWRLENAIFYEKSSPLEIKGVVYNEMKGAMSDPSSQLYYKHLKALYEGTRYALNSGGDPEGIPSLSHTELRDYYYAHYSPRNAKIYTYGTIPPEEILPKISENLDGCSRGEPIPQEEDIFEMLKSRTRTVREFGSMDPSFPENEQHQVALSFILNDKCKNGIKEIELKALVNLLINDPGSPFYESLIEPNIGSGYCLITGYDSSIRYTSMSVGLMGLKKEVAESLPEKIINTFEKAYENGFSESKIRALIHSNKFSLKHLSSGFGLNVGLRLLSDWIQGCNPLETLNFEKKLNALENLIEDPLIFKKLLLNDFLNNSKLTFFMSPRKDYSSAFAARESELISALRTSASPEKIVQNAEELIKLQNAETSCDALPMLSPSEISKNEKVYAASNANSKCSYRNTNTNGITYVYIKIEDVPKEMCKYLSLYCACLAQLPTKNYTLQELSEKINLSIGQLCATPYAKASHEDNLSCTNSVMLKFSFLNENSRTAFLLAKEIALNSNFSDIDKLKTIVSSIGSQIHQNIIDSGHKLARITSEAYFSPVAKSLDMYSGLSFFDLVSRISSQNSFSELASKLISVQQYLSKNPPKFYFVKEKDTSLKDLEPILGTWTRSEEKECTFSPISAPKQFVYIPVPSNVNYTSKSIITVPYAHRDSAPLKILCSLISSKFLHKEIREKIGAYGSGCTMDSVSGMVSFYSYRGPQGSINQIYDVYAKAVKWAENISNNISPQDLQEAIISTFKSIDAPIAPSEEGVCDFIAQIPHRAKQSRRKKLLSVKLTDLVPLAKYLKAPSACAIIGDESEYNALKDSPLGTFYLRRIPDTE